MVRVTDDGRGLDPNRSYSGHWGLKGLLGIEPYRRHWPDVEHAGASVISAREVEVLKCVARGESNHEIAVRLHIADTTVKAHMKNILLKLDAKDRTHAAMVALKRGILQV